MYLFSSIISINIMLLFISDILLVYNIYILYNEYVITCVCIYI